MAHPPDGGPSSAVLVGLGVFGYFERFDLVFLQNPKDGC